VSSITTEQGSVHYEVYGRGRPVILLHGWLGSWALWQETMRYLGQHYRTYALDFWGFGESGTRRNSYSVKDFVVLVEQFMDRLGIASAPLIGHSMGGTVSLATAIQFPDRVSKVVVIGSPLVGRSLAIPLKLAGYRSIARILFNRMNLFRLAMRYYSPIICKDARFPEMMDQDLTRTTLESFLTSIYTLRRTDLRPELSRLKIPVMGMYGARDNIVHPRQWQVLEEQLPKAHIEWFPDAGHFIMLDDPDTCLDKINHFLDDSNTIQEDQNEKITSRNT
jgi:pimeloyl-ACP methyl ester carboxylesterase